MNRSRRSVLTLSAVAVTGLAGCLGNGDDETVDIDPEPRTDSGSNGSDRTPDMGEEVTNPDADVEIDSERADDGPGYDITITVEALDNADSVLVNTNESTYPLDNGETLDLFNYEGTLHIEASDGDTTEFITTYETDPYPPEDDVPESDN